MKKVFAVLIAVALVLSLSVTAFADGLDPNGSAGPGQQQTGGFQWGQMPGGAPQMNGQAPGMGGPRGSSKAPADLPELPGMNGQPPQMNGQMPGMEGRGHGMGPQAPGFVDFDAMVTQGVITQDTCDRIKAYMEEHKPADLPEMDGQAPDGNSQPPEMNGEDPDGMGQPPEKPEMSGPKSSGEAPTDRPEPPEMGGLLAELLENEIITQSEYDALIAAQAR